MNYLSTHYTPEENLRLMAHHVELTAKAEQKIQGLKKLKVKSDAFLSFTVSFLVLEILFGQFFSIPTALGLSVIPILSFKKYWDLKQQEELLNESLKEEMEIVKAIYQKVQQTLQERHDICQVILDHDIQLLQFALQQPENVLQNYIADENHGRQLLETHEQQMMRNFDFNHFIRDLAVNENPTKLALYPLFRNLTRLESNFYADVRALKEHALRICGHSKPLHIDPDTWINFLKACKHYGEIYTQVKFI